MSITSGRFGHPCGMYCSTVPIEFTCSPHQLAQRLRPMPPLGQQHSLAHPTPTLLYDKYGLARVLWTR